MNNKISIVIALDDKLSSINYLNYLHHGYKESENEFVEEQEVVLMRNTFCDLEVELVVGYDKNTKTEVAEYFTKIADKMILVEDVNKEADTFNELFRNCTMDYVCVVKKNVFLQKYWLQELYSFALLISSVGCVSIVSNFMFCEYISLLGADGDMMFGVFLPKEEYFDYFGVLFFNRQLLYLAGGLDVNTEELKCVFEQWQMRCARLGFNNFAIPTQSCIYIPSESISKSHKKLDEAKNMVEMMRKNNQLYVPL